MPPILYERLQQGARLASARGDRHGADIYARQADAVRYAWENRGPSKSAPKKSVWYDTDTKQRRVQISEPGSRKNAAPDSEVAKKPAAQTPPPKTKADAAGVSTRLRSLDKAEVTPELSRELTAHLMSLTLKEMQAVRESLGIDAKGLKSAVKGRLAGAILAHVSGEPAKPAPAPPPAEAAPPPARDPAELSRDPKVMGAADAAYKKLHDETARYGGIVKIPELTDLVRKAVPGVTAVEMHGVLAEWQSQGKLTLQVCNDPHLEPRQADGIRSPRGLLFYVQMRPGGTLGTPAPAPAKAAPEKSAAEVHPLHARIADALGKADPATLAKVAELLGLTPPAEKPTPAKPPVAPQRPAPPKPAPPAKPKAEPGAASTPAAAAAKDAYDRSAHMPQSEFDAALAAVAKLSPADAAGAARAMGLTFPPSTSGAKLRAMIADYMTRRRGSKQRAGLANRDGPGFAAKVAASESPAQEGR